MHDTLYAAYDRFVFRLPIGGFSALHPNLTVVRKELLDPGRGRPDDYLPSCSTCQVYLKLPQYTSEAIMRQKLLQAMTLGECLISWTRFTKMVHFYCTLLRLMPGCVVLF